MAVKVATVPVAALLVRDLDGFGSFAPDGLRGAEGEDAQHPYDRARKANTATPTGSLNILSM